MSVLTTPASGAHQVQTPLPHRSPWRAKKTCFSWNPSAIALSFVVLVWVFGGLLAAALPLVIGGFAILGSMAVPPAVALVTDVSIFALDLTVALGLALAIDCRC
jgi:putative drug exporter of the RND superfamily